MPCRARTGVCAKAARTESGNRMRIASVRQSRRRLRFRSVMGHAFRWNRERGYVRCAAVYSLSASARKTAIMRAAGRPLPDGGPRRRGVDLEPESAGAARDGRLAGETFDLAVI